MSRYLRAFDATVSAAGYNAYHELIRFGVPSLFVPMRRQTDDQEARARYAEEERRRAGRRRPGAAGLESKLDELLDDARREAMRTALREQRPENGAAPAAEWLAGLAASERVRKPGTKRWKRYAAHPVSSARAAAPSRHACRARSGGSPTRLPPARRPASWSTRAISAPSMSRRLLPQAIEDTGEAPEQVLVLTRRVDVLPVLRTAGVGGEHVAAAGRRELILAERPAYQRFVTLDT